MSDTHLRRVTVDLYDAAADLRDGEMQDLRDRRDELVDTAQSEYESAAEAPAELHQRYERLTEQLKDAAGTAETYEHYADEWGDGDTCEFTLEELNGDEFAATLDMVSAEATADGSVPEGAGMVEALKYGVVKKPDAAPPDPGRWPAPITTELFQRLDNLTTPAEVNLGNDSLAAAMDSPAADAATDGGQDGTDGA